jgi:hypothetical protein
MPNDLAIVAGLFKAVMADALTILSNEAQSRS